MSARNVSKVLRRVESRVASGDAYRMDANGVRLLLRALLFDGAGVPDWHALAACRDMDESVFFCPPGTDPVPRVRWAKRVCAGCPVRAECLEDAMAWELPSARVGVLGGLAASEREHLHAARTGSGVAA